MAKTSKPRHTRNEPSEFEYQCDIFAWAWDMIPHYPVLELLQGSLNGIRISPGLAMKCKKAGMKKGYPDIQLPASRCGYIGLFIELKREIGQLEESQRRMMPLLADQGHLVVAVRTDIPVKEILLAYLDEDRLRLETIVKQYAIKYKPIRLKKAKPVKA